MEKIKLFMGAATTEGIKQLESSINDWIEKQHVRIKDVDVTTKGISPEEKQTLKGEVTDQLFICLRYETL